MIPILDFKNGEPGSKMLASVFSDTCSHIAVAKMIQDHLSNKEDIRNLALKNLDLSQAKKILDVGCGFGYFTLGLKGRVHPTAQIMGVDIHPEYEIHYLKACKKIGLKGAFKGSDISCVNKLEENSFDLIISSFSLYFFPHIIGTLSKLLKRGGVMVAITHAVPHMHELTSFVKSLLHSRGIESSGDLPYETLIQNFSSENGEKLLAPYFEHIQRIGCKSSLVFPDGDFKSLKRYFDFKYRFFLPENENHTEDLIGLLFEKVKKEMKLNGRFNITKDDVIFIGSQPVKTTKIQ